MRLIGSGGATPTVGAEDAPDPLGSLAAALLFARLRARELARDRIASVAAVVALAGLGLALLAGQAGLGAQGRIVADFALTAMQLAVDGVAVAATLGPAEALASGGFATTWLARPVPRTAWTVGRWLGLVAVLVALAAAMALAGAGNAALAGVAVPNGYVPAAAMTAVEGAVLAAVCTLLVQWVAPPLAAAASVVLLAAGHLDGAWNAAGVPQAPGWAASALQAALPDFARLSLRGWAAADASVPAAVWASAGAYGFGYASCALVLASLAQRRRLGV